MFLIAMAADQISNRDVWETDKLQDQAIYHHVFNCALEDIVPFSWRQSPIQSVHQLGWLSLQLSRRNGQIHRRLYLGRIIDFNDFH